MFRKINSRIYAFIFWQTNLGEIVNKMYDLNIFLKNSFSADKFNSKESLQAFLTKQYHIIEKGLALPEPRPFFGKAKITKLIDVSQIYLSKYGSDRIIKNIKDTLTIYLDRNEGLMAVDKSFYILLAEFVKGNTKERIGGLKRIDRIELKKAVDINFENFIKSRSSVRFFSEKNILEEDVYKAVEMARYAPSVCNRQSWKVHIFKDRDKIDTLLGLQNGNNGFTQSIKQLLIITGDTKKFTKLESNQVFIDGGLFSMSLLLSLHSKEIASCCLNTCLPYLDEVKVKKIGKISGSERLIMMIGIGNYKDSFEVAISDRIPLDEIISDIK